MLMLMLIISLTNSNSKLYAYCAVQHDNTSFPRLHWELYKPCPPRCAYYFTTVVHCYNPAS